MSKKTILYVGGFQLPDRNSSAIRTLGITRMFNDLGYDTKVGGKIDKEITTYTDIDFWSIEHVGYHKYKQGSQIEPIRAKIKEVGKENLKAIIAYNYAPIAFYKLYRYCKKENIILIPDITEWYSIDGKYTIKSILRVILTNWRIAIISPKCHHMMCSVNYMANRFSQLNSLIIPVVSLEKRRVITPIGLGKGARIKFVYAGSPGINFSKERVDWCIEVFAGLSRVWANFEYHIIGLDKSKILEYNHNLSSDILHLEKKNQLFIHGRMTHLETTARIKVSSFLLFVRPRNRVTMVGFPSKTREALDLGTPVIANDTSDIKSYIESGKNGFIFQEYSKEALKNQLEYVLSLSAVDINKIKGNCATKSPFDWEYFRDKTLDFFSEIG